jgi:hypothetical protein
MKICGWPLPIGNPAIVIPTLFLGGIQLIRSVSEEPTRSGFPTETEIADPKQFRA